MVVTPQQAAVIIDRVGDLFDTRFPAQEFVFKGMFDEHTVRVSTFGFGVEVAISVYDDDGTTMWAGYVNGRLAHSSEAAATTFDNTVIAARAIRQAERDAIDEDLVELAE